jgi:mono/diheme cytochrome c family protein
LIRISRSQTGPGARRLIAAIAIGGFAAAGCTDAAGYDLDYILAGPEFISTMRSTVAPESQTMPRLPAAGTVPVSSPMGEVLPPFGQAALDSVGAVLANPLPATPEVLARGAVVYQNQCMVCHGVQGEGNGPVVGGGRFPLGPAVNNGIAAGRADGYLYGIIRVGRGLMPAYAERITHNDRWAVVHYMRQLQQQAGAAPPPAAVAAPPVDVQQAVEPTGTGAP